MIKVGILSMQRIFNYGSFLQAYGLKSILLELGCEVEFVDYHVGDCLIPQDSAKGLLRKLEKGMEVFGYNAPFKEKIRFIKYKKNYSKNYYPYLGINESMNYLPKLDLLVIGSDEVFNCVQNNANVGFSSELFGSPNRAKRLISYAASCGNTTLKKLEQYNVKDEVSSWLCDFDSISVRDANTRDIVSEITGKKLEYNIDPVLAYDFINKCKEIPNKVIEKQYIILYGYSGRFSDKECKKIRDFADKKGLKIFCIGGVQNCCDKFIDCSPFEVIAYFQTAEAIITDTFHGSIISIITHQNFVSLVRSSGYGNFEKMTDLLKRLKLDDRIIENMNDLDDFFNQDIDYTTADPVIEKERKHTYDYLQGEIELCTQN